MDILFVPLLSTRSLARSGLSVSLSLSFSLSLSLSLSLSPNKHRQDKQQWASVQTGLGNTTPYVLHRVSFGLSPTDASVALACADHPIPMLLSYLMWFTVMCCCKWCDQSAGLYSSTFLLQQIPDQRKKHYWEWRAVIQSYLTGPYWYQLGETNTFSALFKLCHELHMQYLSPKDVFFKLTKWLFVVNKRKIPSSFLCSCSVIYIASLDITPS